MAVRTNFQIARIFGIRVGVGISWFVVLFFFIFATTPYFHEVLGGSSTTAYLVAVASVLSFFASLIVHELGHALVARRNGLGVVGIDLWAFGGITRTSGLVEKPGVEFRVAAAGPLATLGVIVACIVAGALLTNTGHFFEVAVGKSGVRATPALVWLSWVGTINALVLIFNLVPAFPLDGGQLAHATIWWRTGDRNRATRYTGRAGQGFALVLGALGLVGLASGSSFGLLTMLLAFFLYQAAGQAVVQGSLGQRIQGITVADIMDREPVTVPAGADAARRAGAVLPALPLALVRRRRPGAALPRGRARSADRRGDRRGPSRAGGGRGARAGPAGADRRGSAAGVAARLGGSRPPRSDGRGRRRWRAAGRRHAGPGSPGAAPRGRYIEFPPHAIP